MTTAVARPSARMAAILYLAYFVIAGIGQVLAFQDPASAVAAAIQVGGTIWYATVALLLCRLFGDPTRGAGALALVSVVVGCVVQSLYFALGLGRGAEVLALAFFGLFLVCLGYLVLRSALIPRAIGVALIVGGAASSVLWLPFVPAALAPAFLLGGVAELVLLLWLLIFGVRHEPGRSAIRRCGLRVISRRSAKARALGVRPLSCPLLDERSGPRDR